MNISQYIKNLICIIEAANNRHQVKDKISNYFDPILRHLIVIDIFIDTDFLHHIKEINNMLFIVMDLKSDSKLKAKDYYDSFWKAFVKDKDKNKLYADVQISKPDYIRLKANKEDVYNKIDKITLKLSEDLAKKKFVTIVNYLDKDSYNYKANIDLIQKYELKK